MNEEKITGTEKEFLDVFRQLCISRSSWQVWADLMAAMACTLANAVDKSLSRHTAREKEYAECIKRLGGVEKPAKCFNYIVEQARKQSNGRSTAVEDQVVYEWAEDYYHKYEKPETAKKEKDKKPATTKKTEAPAKKVTEIKKDIQETKNDSKVSEKPEKKDAASKQRKTEKTSTKGSGLNGQISLFDLL